MIKIFSTKKFLSIRKKVSNDASITETCCKYSISIRCISSAIGFPKKSDMAQKQRNKISPIFGLFIAFQRRSSRQ
ncbi:hypothetical protein [Desulfosporosinus youngiae]|uniref:Uncharacterized protein n=1 Tax=Desulfosporosinus youngiae DSM 17734 TaxID=768710 RepID=H5XWR6_9FIRM|nr:hypothetical protein [Desulfosporosinus youngiae]EHQ90715.1 hypothetical protein DesyoDRAFT_3723 [Desulfosporosinus youngiae DSM 17734]